MPTLSNGQMNRCMINSMSCADMPNDVTDTLWRYAELMYDRGRNLSPLSHACTFILCSDE